MQRESIAFCAIGVSIRKRFYDAIVERVNPRNAERRSIGSKISKSPEYKSRQSPSETFVDAAENRFDERGSAVFGARGGNVAIFRALDRRRGPPDLPGGKREKKRRGYKRNKKRDEGINVPRYRGKAANVRRRMCLTLDIDCPS